MELVLSTSGAVIWLLIVPLFFSYNVFFIYSLGILTDFCLYIHSKKIPSSIILNFKSTIVESNPQSVLILLRYFFLDFYVNFSPIWQRIPLDFLSGEKFQAAAESHIRPLLTKVFIWVLLLVFSLVDLFMRASSHFFLCI